MSRPLTNEQWGLETSCFVCEPSNPMGLRLPFHADDEAGTVFAEFTFGPEHSGAPTVVHGGITLAVLDEAQAWAVIALGGVWAVTRTTSATFDGPVFVDRPHRVVARVTGAVDDDGNRLATSAEVLDGDGAVLVRGTSEFVVLGEAQAVTFGAEPIIETHRDHLRAD